MRATADMMTSLFSLRNFFYFVYAVILLTILLYVRFPTDKFKVYCENQIKYYLQLDTCTIETIKYRFPLALVFKNINVEEAESRQTNTIKFTEITILARAKRFGRNFEVQGSLYGGTFQSELKIEQKGQTFLLDNITVSGIQLNQLMDSFQLNERKSQGKMNFIGMYKAPVNEPFDGTGSGNISVMNGSFHLSQKILGLSDINFKNLQFQVTHDNELIKLDAGLLMSEQFKSVFTGEITLQKFWTDSRLQLKGTIEPTNKLYTSSPGSQKYVKRLLKRYNMTELPYHIGGSFKIPTFRFGR